jgi:hypothetical protein
LNRIGTGKYWTELVGTGWNLFNLVENVGKRVKLLKSAWTKMV